MFSEKVLAARLQQARTAKGLSQRQLAFRLGISPRAVGQFEQGRNAPSLETLVAIATALDASTDYLLGLSLPDPHVTPEGGERRNDG